MVPISGNNYYIEEMKRIYSNFGEVKNLYSWKAIYSPFLKLQLRRHDFAVVNWLENELVNKKGEMTAFSIFKVFAIMTMIRILFKKLIYIKHNHYSHHIQPKYKNRVISVWASFESWFDWIIVHCPRSTKHGTYVPHPLLTLHEEPRNIKKTCAFSDRDYYISFGRISPYKKLDILVENFPLDRNLLIAGICIDHSYGKYLEKISGSNIKLYLEYVDDMTAITWIKNSLGLISVHNSNDMIVSGSIMFALSARSPIITRKSPFSDWLCEILGPKCISIHDTIEDICTSVKDSSFALELSQPSLKLLKREFSNSKIISSLNPIFRENQS